MDDEFVPNPPGGLVDTSARIVAEVLPKTTGQGPMCGTVPTAFGAPDNLHKGGLDQ